MSSVTVEHMNMEKEEKNDKHEDGLKQVLAHPFLHQEFPMGLFPRMVELIHMEKEKKMTNLRMA